MDKLLWLLPVLPLIITGCDHTTNNQQEQQTVVSQEQLWTPPPPGNVADQFEKRVDEDQLNEKYFRVTIISTERSTNGAYLLKLEYGHNINERNIQLPSWLGDTPLRPSIKEGNDKYHCYIGFEANDNQFRELYEVKATNGDISLKQTRQYYLEKK